MGIRGFLTGCSAIALSCGVFAPSIAVAQTVSQDGEPAPGNPSGADQNDERVPGRSQTDALDQPSDTADSLRPAAGSDIVVTGSRVVRDGYQAPTPITVVGTEELRNTAPNLAEALRQIPQLTGSTGLATPAFTPSGTVSSTAGSANLRNLGITRTLVLLDGRRPAPSGVTGVPDTSLFPQQLVERVDIVTGGASAAYGSDAVAGVVNYVLDTDFRGFLIEGRNGISTHGDGHLFNVEGSAGFGFAGDRGSIVLSGSIGGQDGVFGDQRDWAQRGFVAIPNPAFGQPGQPQLLLRENVTLAAGTYGGLIARGPLRNTQFDANGNPIPFNPGELAVNTVGVGGDGPRYPKALLADFSNFTSFGHAEFDVTDTVSVFAEASYGGSRSTYPNLLPFNLGGGSYVIQLDNAFLPSQTRQAMIDAGVTSIALSKIDSAFGFNEPSQRTKVLNLVTGFRADIGRFTLDGYYGHGDTRYDLITTNQRITDNARLAVDAVRNPATGAIVCRSTLTNPGNGCVPFNPFGIRPYTAEQRAYQQGTGTANSVAKQDVVALNLRGDLFENWAGDVSAAIGGEYRDLSGVITVDPISNRFGFTAGNAQPSAGSFDVREVFGEVLVPLFRGDDVFRTVDFNGAVRYTDYSTSGGVVTYKLGLTSEIIPDLLVRGTFSRDIRAPNIGDLFGPRARALASLLDPFNGNRTTQNIFVSSGGNPDLTPERARTIAGGFSYRPAFIPGLGFSIDYYNIKIDDAISVLSFQQIINLCFEGDQSLCSLITRDAGGTITDINGFALNVASVKISGVDFDASYQMDLGSGSLNFRAIATYLDDFTQINPGVAPLQRAGTESTPRWRANLQATYTNGGTTIAVQQRFIAALDRFGPPITVDENRVPPVFYTNLTIRQEIEAGDVTPELFLTINNLFDRDPPPTAMNNLTIAASNQADVLLYDTVGRYFTVGARLRF